MRPAAPVRAAEGQIGLTTRHAVTGGGSVKITTKPTGFAEGKTYAVKVQAQLIEDLAAGYMTMGAEGSTPTAAAATSYPIVEGEIFIWHVISGYEELAYIQRDGTVDTWVYLTELAPEAA